MGQVRNGSATTTYAVRAAMQRSQASLAQLRKKHCIDPQIPVMNEGASGGRSGCEQSLIVDSGLW